MAVKASVTITISKYRDTNNITRYYKLQASTASKPAKPTTLTPSGWTDTEPTYTSGSTNTLYFTDRYVFSDGTFQYTEVSKSTSYEAAKEAYNKAQAAQNGATSANNKIDNLQIGGRNFLKGSKDLSGASLKKTISSDTFNGFSYIDYTAETNSSYIDILSWNKLLEPEKNQYYTLSFWAKGTQTITSYFFPNNVAEGYSSTGSKTTSVDGRIYIKLTSEWTRYWIVWKTRSDVSGLKNIVVGRLDNKRTGQVCIAGPKLEIGNKPSDWTPAPEDMNDAIDNLQIGGRNYFIGSSNEWSKWITPGKGINKCYLIGKLDLRNLKLKYGDYISMQIEMETADFSEDLTNFILNSQGAVNGVWGGDNHFTNPFQGVDGHYFIEYRTLASVNKITKHTRIYKFPDASIDKINNIGGIIEFSMRADNLNAEAKYRYRCLKIEIGNKITDWTPAPEDTNKTIGNLQNDYTYFKETTFTSYKRDQEANNKSIKDRLSRTEVTVYGDPEDPNDPKALINHVQKVDNDINGSGGLDDRLEAAEGTIDGTGLNEYDQRVKITQRFLNIETDVESIKNIFNITGGTNLIQNSVGYFASNNNKPTMWDITSNTIYTPFGYDGDLTGITVSRGRLFCAKGSIKTTANNIIALLSNKMISVSFKYKNGANATSKIKIFNGSTIYFEKTFNTTVNQWTEYKFNPNTDPALANPTFLNTSNSLQISIESTNSTNNNGFEISDLMLNYGNVKPWELSGNEVYGAMVKLSSLGIEVTATTANTKNFMTTDGILVYRYDSKTDKIIGTEPITKITDNGTVTNKLESTGDIIERNLIQTMIKDSSNNDIYVEYIR